MIDVISNMNRHLYQAELEHMSRLRDEICVHERDWHGSRGPGDRGIDRFDTDEAVYLLAIEGTSTVVAGACLIPTSEPNIVSEVFPGLASVRGVPCSPRIFDWTRCFVVPWRREVRAISPVASELMCAVQEFSLGEGIDQIQILLDTFWIPRFIEIGWNPRPLGLPELVAGAPVAAVLCDVSEEILRKTRQLRGDAGPCLRSRDRWRHPGGRVPGQRAAERRSKEVGSTR